MGLGLGIVALAAAVAGQETMLPPSLQPGELEVCAPTTLEAAERCLKAALSPEDLAIVEQRFPARRFRPNLDKEITRAWRLADPASPMAQVMDGLLGQHMPDVAAGMIIGDLQARALGKSLNFSEIAEMIRQSPVPDAPDGTPVTFTAPTTKAKNDH